MLSGQYAREGILVNNVAPGYIMTARQQAVSIPRAVRLGISTEEYMQRMTKDIPLKRHDDPGELVKGILGSERSGSMTGATVVADGGLSRGLF